jgi:hypothetical protein
MLILNKKADEMNQAYATHGEMRNGCKNLVGKSEEKTPKSVKIVV